MDRRTFLKRGSMGGALLLVGGASLAAWEGPTVHQPTKELLALDAFAFSVVAAASEAILIGLQANPVVIAHKVDAALSHAAPEAQADFRDLARVLNSPLVGLLDGRMSPFLSLDVDGRLKALQAWAGSSLALRSSGVHALRKLTVASFYSDPGTWQAMGYPGPPSQLLHQVGEAP